MKTSKMILRTFLAYTLLLKKILFSKREDLKAFEKSIDFNEILILILINEFSIEWVYK